MKVIFFCTQEEVEVASLDAVPGARITADLVRRGLDMASGMEDLEDATIASASTGAPLRCPRCKSALSVTYPGEAKADVIKAPRRLPLGCFRVPE